MARLRSRSTSNTRAIAIDRLTGSGKVRQAIESGTLAALLDDWDRDAAAFRERRKAFLLYQ